MFRYFEVHQLCKKNNYTLHVAFKAFRCGLLHSQSDALLACHNTVENHDIAFFENVRLNYFLRIRKVNPMETTLEITESNFEQGQCLLLEHLELILAN